VPRLPRHRLCRGPRGGRHHLQGERQRGGGEGSRDRDNPSSPFSRPPALTQRPTRRPETQHQTQQRKGCGLVVEAHIIDERSEWRTFGDKDKGEGGGGDDPSRVGAAANALFADGGLSTVVGRVTGDGAAAANALHRLHTRQVGASERSLQAAARAIAAVCDRLALVEGVKRRAAEVFKETHDARALRGRANPAIYAACIYLACRQEGAPRTFKEITAVLTDANKRDIGRCYSAMFQMYQRQKQEALAVRSAARAAGEAAGGAGAMGAAAAASAAASAAAAAAAAAPQGAGAAAAMAVAAAAARGGFASAERTAAAAAAAAAAAGGGDDGFGPSPSSAGAGGASLPTGPALRGPGGGAAAATSAVDVIKRVTARLGFDPPAANAARHTALRAHELAGEADVPWAGRNPATVAGAVAVAVHLLARVKAADAAAAAAAAAAGGGAAAAAAAGGGGSVAARLQQHQGPVAEISWSEFNAKVGMASQTLRTALQDMQPWLTTFVSFLFLFF